MTIVGSTKARDERIFGSIVRDKIYRGDDKSFTSKGEITSVPPRDVNVKPLIAKFSTYDLNRMLPEQRILFISQMRYEVSLTGKELNDYLSERYNDEDMYHIWKMQQGPTRKALNRKMSISKKAHYRKFTKEQWAEINAKRAATRERNKNNPDYISYKELQRQFMRRQKLLAQRYEERTKQAVEKYSEKIIRKRIDKSTKELYRENKQLREYIRMNGLAPPNYQSSRDRRKNIRSE